MLPGSRGTFIGNCANSMVDIPTFKAEIKQLWRFKMKAFHYIIKNNCSVSCTTSYQAVPICLTLYHSVLPYTTLLPRCVTPYTLNHSVPRCTAYTAELPKDTPRSRQEVSKNFPRTFQELSRNSHELLAKICQNLAKNSQRTHQELPENFSRTR